MKKIHNTDRSLWWRSTVHAKTPITGKHSRVHQVGFFNKLLFFIMRSMSKWCVVPLSTPHPTCSQSTRLKVNDISMHPYYDVLPLKAIDVKILILIGQIVVIFYITNKGISKIPRDIVWVHHCHCLGCTSFHALSKIRIFETFPNHFQRSIDLGIPWKMTLWRPLKNLSCICYN